MPDRAPSGASTLACNQLTSSNGSTSRKFCCPISILPAHPFLLCRSPRTVLSTLAHSTQMDEDLWKALVKEPSGRGRDSLSGNP
jgi:hypothetical protein